jgi:hypothetical protein
METSRDVFDGIWNGRVGSLYATPPRFPYMMIGEAFLLRPDFAPAHELSPCAGECLSQSLSRHVSVSNLPHRSADLLGVFGLAPFRSPLATVALKQDDVTRAQVKLWAKRRDDDLADEAFVV